MEWTHLSPETSGPPHLLQLKHFTWYTASPALMTISFAGIALPQLPQMPLLPNILQQDKKKERLRLGSRSRHDIDDTRRVRPEPDASSTRKASPPRKRPRQMSDYGVEPAIIFQQVCPRFWHTSTSNTGDAMRSYPALMAVNVCEAVVSRIPVGS